MGDLKVLKTQNLSSPPLFLFVYLPPSLSLFLPPSLPRSSLSVFLSPSLFVYPLPFSRLPFSRFLFFHQFSSFLFILSFSLSPPVSPFSFSTSPPVPLPSSLSIPFPCFSFSPFPLQRALLLLPYLPNS